MSFRITPTRRPMRRATCCLAVWLLLAGCTTTPADPELRSDRTALLKLRADGIYAHPEHPDDLVWARLYRRGSYTAIGAKKLTIEAPIARFSLDADTAYVIEFVSTEAQSSGVTNCLARTELQPLEGARYAMTYHTARSSCRIESGRLDSQTGRYTLSTTSVGVVGGVPYAAR